jgi:pimeloyl-ACP methyl ester carboxylesterase
VPFSATLVHLGGVVRERHSSVRGLTLRLRERGAGEPSVLLHGWLDHCGSFDALAPRLPGWTVAYDQRGHGQSAWVGPGGFYHFVEYLADLDGVIGSLGVAGPVRLVGHSMGAAVALYYAAVRPERVAHVTLLDGLPLATYAREVPERLAGWLDDLGKDRRRRTVGSVDEARARLLRNNPNLSAEAVEALAGPLSPDPEQGGALAWTWDPLLRARSPLPVSEDVTQELLGRVRAKVLLLRAENGILPDERAVRDRFARIASLQIETIAGSGHHLHLEQPDEVAARIRTAWGET